uniref:Cold and drought-regulated protein CORA-like n=1 Tax=Nicotiana tabacum TaxID=4097 RepID=A0A1S4AY98_TOBAC|nr:PREDICTED: cold and drought-regulated protein CORA-like [Nicotiana tabacum]
MVLQTQLGLNKHQPYAHEQNCYSDSSHGGSMQMTRPSGYSTMPYGQSTHNHMMMGHGGQHHGGQYGGHGHGGHYGSQGPHMPHDSTNFSSNTSMVHNDGGYGSGMQQSAHMYSATGMGSPNYHGHGYGGGSHPSQYSQSQKFNWALKDLEE